MDYRSLEKQSLLISTPANFNGPNNSLCLVIFKNHFLVHPSITEKIIGQNFSILPIFISSYKTCIYDEDIFSQRALLFG